MRAATISATAFLLAISGGFSSARADSASATCEVREDGKVKKDASGPCTFHQAQGGVDLTLTNGFTHVLSPTDRPNHYKDAKGHKVERAVNGDTQVYKWDDRKIIVSFGAAPAASGSGGVAVDETPSDLKDLVGGKKVGGEVEDEMTRRGWTHGRDQVSGDDVWSYWRKGKQCVVIHLDKARKVETIVGALESSCKE